MTGPTISTKLAACLQEAGYACPACGGYGSVPAEPLSDMRLQACPECLGSRLNAEHRAIEAANAICQTCHHDDGELNTDYLCENGSCLFGCGSRIESGYGDWPICTRCGDHSRNEAVCERCQTRYQYNDSTWEKAT